jgi:ATP-dependent Clp protease ATP-binding subunit ClpC
MAQHSHGVILVLTLAETEANAFGSVLIEPAHLLLGLCKLSDLSIHDALAAVRENAPHLLPELEAEAADIRQVFAEAEFDAVRFRRRLRTILGGPAATPEGTPLHRSPASRQVFKRSEQLAAAANSALRPLHLLAALLEIDKPPWHQALGEAGLAAEKLLAVVRARVQGMFGPGEPARDKAPPAERREQPPRSKARTSILAEFGRDLTQLARDGQLEPVIGRRAEMKTLAQILLQKRKGNAILVGEPGVGKTGIVEGLAARIAGLKPPPGLSGKRIVEVTMAALVAGTKYRGEFEERMQGLVREASGDPHVILFIDEIHTLLGAGGSGSSDAANILKPALARGQFSCIGATTVADYRQSIEKDRALERRFQVVWVEEPSRDEALEILRGTRAKLQEHHGLTIDDEALTAAVDLSIRYLTEFRLPDKALDLLDQACSQARMASLSVHSMISGHAATNRIGRAEIAQVVAHRCRIPVERLTDDEAARLLRMEDFLGQRVIGQDEAVAAVCGAIRTARAGLKNPNRPQGVFLFLGSTGTGKTELAKALAEFLFDDERRLIRFDMSEYMEEHSVARLIGAPPGYIGHDQEGQLTGALRSNPYSVVLFDEIEKAHPRVLDLFLQIFDDGRLTDAQGRRASFRDCVIILTSNLGSGTSIDAAEKRPFGFAAQQAYEIAPPVHRPEYRQGLLAAVQREFRPELVNRISQIVVFQPLTADSVRRIIDKILTGLRQRLTERGISLGISPAVYDWLMLKGYSPAYGAREMERVIEINVVQPLGQALLGGRFQAGSEVHVAVSAGELTFC